MKFPRILKFIKLPCMPYGLFLVHGLLKTTFPRKVFLLETEVSSNSNQSSSLCKTCSPQRNDIYLKGGTQQAFLSCLWLFTSLLFPYPQVLIRAGHTSNTKKSLTVSSWDNNTCSCLSSSKGCSGHSSTYLFSPKLLLILLGTELTTLYLHICVFQPEEEKK